MAADRPGSAGAAGSGEGKHIVALSKASPDIPGPALALSITRASFIFQQKLFFPQRCLSQTPLAGII
ncbi:MAG: hypothetical protein OEZ59_03220 [Deltaproteobacteria bacterium]|nr:hypothetical protein [Deltaproteobacteria bacterium]